MKVIKQKNIYYVDLNKSLYRGYVETEIVREFNEKVIVFKSTHLIIEDVFIIDYEEKLKVEHFSTKASKQKFSKNNKTLASNNDPSKIQNEIKEDKTKLILPENNESPTKTSENTNVEDGLPADFGVTPLLGEKISSCYDSFRLKIPDYVFDSKITIRLVFSPTKNNPSILWYKPVSKEDKHREVVACNFYDNASCIFPYIDCITHFNLIYSIPNTEDSKVVSSGNFKSIKEEDKNIVYLYSICTHPKYLSFAVGSFVQNDIFNDSDRRKMFSPCCIDTDFSEISNDLQSIIKYIEGFTKTKELSTCNILFSMLNIDSFVAKNIVVCRFSYFPSSRDIEVSYYLKRILSDLLSSQVYHFLNWCTYDLWIDIGLSGYLSDYCVRYLLGNNEFISNYYQDKKFVIENDVVEPPLFYTFRKEFECQNEFFKKKSKLLFHCMEAHLSYAFLQKISDEVLEFRKIKFEVPDQCIMDDNETNSIQNDCYSTLKRCFTLQFMKIIKDATGKDLKTLFDFYLFRPGLMKVRINFQINKKKNSVRATMTYIPTSILPKANKKFLHPIDIKSIELEGNFDHSVVSETDTSFLYHTRIKKKKKEDEEEVMPLLYIRVDPKRLNLFEYIAEQPDYMHIEQLQEKNVIGQLESIESLALKPTFASCEALERMLDNAHVFYKVRIRAAYVLRSTLIEGYNGLQRIVQYFIKSRCVLNSTVLKGNEFGLISYFIQKHLVRCISVIDVKNENIAKDTKIVLSFYENILKFNDNSLSKFDDSWYISSVINLFTYHTLILTSLTTHDLESLSGSDYFNCGFSKLIEETANQSDNIDDFFGQKSFIGSKQKTVCSVDHMAYIEKCMDILERFRISDLVFPSNNNVITRICLLSYVRLGFYNKIKLSKEALKGHSSYPNLLSVRAVAVEGLLLLFSDSVPFILESIKTEVPAVIQTFLELIIKVYKLDLRVHLQDTNEYDVKLAERIRVSLEQDINKLIEIYKNNFIHPKINEQIRKILCIIDNKTILISNLKDHYIKKYDFNKEESNRATLLKAPSSSKKIRVADLTPLREAAFEISYSIRIPRIKNYKPKPYKDTRIKQYKIRIKPSRFLVKYRDNFTINIKVDKSKTPIRKEDFPILIVKKYKDNRNLLLVDDFISNNKSTGFFPWEAHTANQILDLARTQKLDIRQAFIEIERAIVFVLSYNSSVSKAYIAAKTLYNAMEAVLLQKAFIVNQISPLSSELKELCIDFLGSLTSNPKFELFRLPVDTKELKSYLDIVRVPVCLLDIENNMQNYNSFDAFIITLERIYVNCLNFNDSRSLIVEYAFELKAAIDKFKSSVCLEHINSKAVIKNIVELNNTEKLLDPVLDSIPGMVSWGDFDNAVTDLKKKFTRSSQSGKLVAIAIKDIRDALRNWFLVDNARVLIIV